MRVAWCVAVVGHRILYIHAPGMHVRDTNYLDILYSSNSMRYEAMSRSVLHMKTAKL